MTGSLARGGRALAVLVVALGVLAMHGAPHAHHGLTAVMSPTASVTADHTHAAGTPAVFLESIGGLSEAVLGPLAGCDEGCPSGSDGVLMLCLIVLASAAGLLAAIARRRILVALLEPALAALRPRSSRPRPRADLVAELCISRT